MRTLLAVLNHVETAGAVLASAGLVASRLPQARIDVLQVRAEVDPTFLPTEEIMTPERQAHFEATTAELSADLRASFETWRRGSAQLADIGWREEIGDQASVVVREGAKADLVVICLAPQSEPGDGWATIEAALFEGEAPILLVPKVIPETIGAHIAVAWKPSETAERAVTAAVPLLRLAERVTILIGAESEGDTPPPAALLQVLAERNLVPAMHPFTPGTRSIGAALLDEARHAGADLLVMGAYAHPRIVEALTGGATRDILAGADMPVLMHH